ncbi:proline-rich receptor-like protein kinase PERK1 isoform X1 [Silene latifolia]
MQHWQQNYSPPAEHYPVPPQPPPPTTTPPRPPPRPPSPQLPPVPAPFMSRTPGSWSSIASENMLPPLSPGNSLGYSSTFSYLELAMATNYFSEANMLGQSDFGNVHKGILPNGKEIAVKSLNSGSGQGELEFQTEVEIIGRVHHKHLVSLVGYCITGSHWFLVYEFVPNRTLEFHLHGEGQPTMDWPTRIRIALGSAKGLAYLHEDCHPKIIHGNIKSAYILLNDKFEAKVSDFGRAKVSPDGTHVSTRVIGTIGYLAPEYAATGKLSDKSDVFSFGVVLLELITGCPPVKPEHTYINDSFVDWARPLLKRFLEDRKLDSLVDPRLQNKYDPSEMARMIVCATACLRHKAQRRPRMSQVVRALEGELSLTDNSEGIGAGPSTTYTSHSSDNNEAVRRRYNSMYTSQSSDNDSSPYKEDLKRVNKGAVANQADGSSEYDGTTSEYGLYPSGLSSEIQSQETTREIEPRKVKNGKDGNGL